MGRVTKLGLLMLLILVLMMSAACGNSSNNTSSAPKEQKQPEQKQDKEGKTEEKKTIKIGLLASKTGILEAYGKQTIRGFELGLEYATGGKMEVNGHKIEYIIEDTETKPDVAVLKATKLLEEDKVDFIVGSSSSGDTLAVLPLAADNKTIMVVEPAVADSITGSEWNKYIFRTGRNSSQDAVAGAAAIAGKGVKIATFAPDGAFGRDGVAAFKEKAISMGAEIVEEQYADPKSTDFTANIQKIINSKPDYLFVIWAGANSPWKQFEDMKVTQNGIKISTGAPDIAALKTMQNLVGMEGFTVYHYTLPNNEVNDWLVEEHKKRFNGEVPDLFTPGGMSAAIAVIEAIKKTGGNTDAEVLIKAMEGMSFETPKGTMTFRAEDHQALQTLYGIKLEAKDGFDYPVPVLTKELSPEETAPPIRNK
jgi:branched-chain amino acid transport system substrate-binding protein